MADNIRNDEGKNNRIAVIYSLSLFAEGIEPYVKDKFDSLHQTLLYQTQHIQQRCALSCSKHEKEIRNWCSSCSTWRSAILSNHVNRTNMSRNNVDWTVLDSSKWPSDPREVQKCFNPEWCFKNGVMPDSSDVAVLTANVYNVNMLPSLSSKLNTIRRIRNKIIHTHRITADKRKNSCQCLLDCLRSQDVLQYHKAREAADLIDIFLRKNMHEIIEESLINQELLNELEYKTIVERNRSILLEYTKWTIPVIISTILAYYYRLYSWQSDCDLGFGLDIDIYIPKESQFTGREWLFDEIKKTLTDRSKQGIIISANPGYGKSTAMAQIALKKQKIGNFDIVYHFCKDEVKTLKQSDLFVLNLMQKLNCMYPAFAKILKTKKDDSKGIRVKCAYDVVYCFDTFIVSTLTKFSPKKEKKLVILIDALDECQTATGQSIVQLLYTRYSAFPNWIKFIFTTRIDNEIIYNFGNLRNLTLSKEAVENKQDIEKYIAGLFHGEGHEAFARSFALDIQYDFLFLKFVISASKVKQISYDNFPNNIYTAFKREMERLYDKCEAPEFGLPRTILEIIAASFEPLTRDDVFEYSKYADHPIMDEYLFDEIITKMTPHILTFTETGGISFYHLLFKEWLTSNRRKGHSCYVNIKNGHKTIAKNLLREMKDYENTDDVIFDRVNNLVAHLNEVDKNEYYEEMKQLPSFIVDKVYCFEYFNRTTCQSPLDVNAKCIHSYKIMKLLLSITQSTNVTMAVLNAVISNHTENVKALLEYGKVDYSSLLEMFDLTDLYYDHEIDRYIEKDAFTVLHFAISHENIEVVKMMIFHNTLALQYNTRSGFSVLHQAIFKDDIDIFALISKYLPLESELLHYAAYLQSHKIVKFILEQGIKDKCITCDKSRIVYNKRKRTLYVAKLNATLSLSETRVSPFNAPYTFINKKFTSLMIEITCESALHHAVRMENSEIANQILKHGKESLECQDFQGLTPFGTSVVFQSMWGSSMIRFLLMKGAKMDFECKPVDVDNRMHIMQELNVFELGVFYDKYDFDYCKYAQYKIQTEWN